jgi:cell wall-associated NlpC family hydrolase
MPGPAATLSQALNGTGKASSNGGYNPFAATAQNPNPDPGAAASSDVQQNQANYASQQALAKAQLQSSLAPASVGGQIQANGQDVAANAVAGTQGNQSQLFQSTINTITQQGADATQIAQQQQAQKFAKMLADQNSTYNSNLLGNANSMGQMQYVTGADPNSNMGARAVALAKQSLGVNYLYGGNSLTQGVDCSGLVQQVYAKLGIRLPRTSTEQAKYGKIVPSLSQALPGDLILMYSPYEQAGLQQFGHVGIYIGNGMMIDAPHTGAKVRIERISNMTRIVRPW